MKSCLPLLLTPVLLASLVSAQVLANGSAETQATRQQNPASTPAASALDLTPDQKGMLSEEQMRNLLRVTADHDVENDKRQRDYTTSTAKGRSSRPRCGPAKCS